MAQSPLPTGVLLVGSVPLDTTREVFTKLCKALPQRLTALPDGETGERYNYIAWQIPRFPPLALREEMGGLPLPTSGPSGLGSESWKPTNYDTAALASYKEFLSLRKQQQIPPDIRFQICLPTPYNCIRAHTKPELLAEVEPMFETRFFESCHNIVRGVDPADVVIQWDIALEIIALEVEAGRYPDRWPRDRWQAYFSPVKEGVLERVLRCCQQFPPEFRQAFHLCYGDYGHEHLIEPVDLRLLVDLANDIVTEVRKTHPIEWIHMPVPKGRDDVEYFQPLNQLSLENSRLYLGLVHPNDEVGTLQRIKAAQSVYPHSFGVATECGMGRTPRGELDSILSISQAVTAPA